MAARCAVHMPHPELAQTAGSGCVPPAPRAPAGSRSATVVAPLNFLGHWVPAAALPPHPLLLLLLLLLLLRYANRGSAGTSDLPARTPMRLDRETLQACSTRLGVYHSPYAGASQVWFTACHACRTPCADTSRGFGFLHMADEQSATTAREVRGWSATCCRPCRLPGPLGTRSGGSRARPEHPLLPHLSASLHYLQGMNGKVVDGRSLNVRAKGDNSGPRRGGEQGPTLQVILSAWPADAWAPASPPHDRVVPACGWQQCWYRCLPLAGTSYPAGCVQAACVAILLHCYAAAARSFSATHPHLHRLPTQAWERRGPTTICRQSASCTWAACPTTWMSMPSPASSLVSAPC